MRVVEALDEVGEEREFGEDLVYFWCADELFVGLVSTFHMYALYIRYMRA